eukprot:scaffold1894_cov368-Prasinococcus_capsulatus_cf.AAC.6
MDKTRGRVLRRIVGFPPRPAKRCARAKNARRPPSRNANLPSPCGRMYESDAAAGRAHDSWRDLCHLRA